jgi:hypothetical protein
MLYIIGKYTFIVVTSFVVIQELLRLINRLFKPKILNHKRFEFPTDKYSQIGYHICLIAFGIIAILIKLNII